MKSILSLPGCVVPDVVNRVRESMGASRGVSKSCENTIV